MIRYAAFLRAINVGGKNLIKMQNLKQIFESSGLKNITTYIQSGNVIFESDENKTEVLESKIEIKLHKSLSEDVLVFVRTVDELKRIIEVDPFQKLGSKVSPKFYITFLKEKLKRKLNLPYFSSKKDVKIIHADQRELYSVPLEVNGKFGFPNIFIEKEFGVKATTRNWNTISKILNLKQLT